MPTAVRCAACRQMGFDGSKERLERGRLDAGTQCGVDGSIVEMHH